MYQPATDMVPTRYRLATGKLPITHRQIKDRAQNCSFHFQSIVSLAMDSERQFPEYTEYTEHVYSYETSFYYIKGKLRGHYVTLKRYRWKEKDEVQQDQFSKSLC